MLHISYEFINHFLSQKSVLDDPSPCSLDKQNRKKQAINEEKKPHHMRH